MDFTPMLVRDDARDREAEAALAAQPPEKRLEQAASHLGRHGRSGVFDREREPHSTLCMNAPRLDRHCAAFRCSADRIGQKTCDGPAEVGDVPKDRREVRGDALNDSHLIALGAITRVGHSAGGATYS
jgi:hypothetical protein